MEAKEERRGKMHFTKKARPALLLILLLGMIPLLTACKVTENPAVREDPNVLQQSATVERYDLSVVTTVGNHSYIPFNIHRGLPADYVNEILGALQAFEKAHPELEVTGWHIEKEGGGYAHTPHIFGLWVDHQPK